MRLHREARVIDLWLNTELKVESDAGSSDFQAKLQYYLEWPERFLVIKTPNAFYEERKKCVSV